VVVLHHELARRPKKGFSDVEVHAVFPVGMPYRLRGAREQELPRHEEIVGDRVGGEVCQVAVADRLKRLVRRGLENFSPNLPAMAVTPLRHILLRKGDVRGDRTVQEVGRIPPDYGADCRRK